MVNTDKALDPIQGIGALDPGTEIEVDLGPDEASTVVPLEDGGVEVTIGEEVTTEAPKPRSHGENLAEFLDRQLLATTASELIDLYDADERSREEWKKTYEEGLTLIGIRMEERTEPWDGACGVFHPLMAEAAIRFQSQAITEIFPAAGPVKTQVVGKETPERIAQSKRVAHEMNYQLTEKMVEYRDETEALLFRTALAGSCFKKVYFDPIKKRPRAMMAPAEDIVVNYQATSLLDAERITHIQRKSETEMKRLVAKGFYRKVDIQTDTPETSELQEAEDDIKGQEEITEASNDYKLLEIHTYLDNLETNSDGMPRPYVVTIHEQTQTILAIRRNWVEGDEECEPQQHFVHYKYLPGLGFYGIGLISLIGGLTKGATSVLRQLVDAGTLSNLPAGFKAKGLRWKNEDEPLGPGEWRDVDVGSGSIRDNLMPLPYKEPSAVLYQLMQNIVEEGRRLGSIAEVDMSKMTGEAPVGTVLAILERNLKVQTAVHSRLHAALRDELRLIVRIIRNDMAPEYDYEVEGDFTRLEDFNAGVNILPVSDPNAATMSQRIVQHQAVLQNAAAAPEIYDLPRLHRTGLEILDWPDPEKIIPLDDDMKPRDPISENMSVLKREPVRAFIDQDHESHLAVHMAALQDPKLQALIGQSQFGGQIQSAMEAHITEHLAFAYRRQMEQALGVPLPEPDVDLPPDVEAQLAYLAAQAANKVLGKNITEQQAQAAQQAANDPLTALQNRELDIKEKAIESKERIEGAKLGVKLVTEDRQADRADKTEGVRLGVQIADTIHQRKVQEQQAATDTAFRAHDAAQKSQQAAAQQAAPPAKE